MSVRSFGNSLASFRYRFGRTGNRASKPFEVAFSATGGTKTTSGLYTIHTFSYPNSQNFVVESTFTGTKEVEYLVVANYPGPGGGSGGIGNRETGTSTPAPTQGNNGSPAPGIPTSSGAGGGGGGAGGAASGMPGGAGIALSISGSSVTYSSGGRGQDGTADGGAPATLTNYGEGGNAKYGGGSPTNGGTGANGIVIIRYLTP
jgi:hypothetical protein